MARLTLAQARAALAELLQLLDVEGSPELVATINRSIAAAQRTLAMRERWLLPTQRSTQAMSPGRTIYASPSREGVSAVGVQADPNLPPQYLQRGIALDDVPYSGGPGPWRWDHRVSQGVASVTVSAGGTGYVNGAAVTFPAPSDGSPAAGVLQVSAGVITGVTITDPGVGYTSAPTPAAPTGTGAVLVAVLGEVDAILVAPPPQQAWTLAVDHRPVPPLVLADGDRLVMDELAVIYAAAMVIGPSSGSPRASTIGAEASEYLKGLRGAGAAGTSFQAGASVDARRGGLVYRNGRWYHP